MIGMCKNDRVVISLLHSFYLDKTCHLTFNGSVHNTLGHDSRPLSVAVGYFNKDIYLDIAVANSGTDMIGIFFGHGNGTFGDQISYLMELGSRPYSLAVGDFNNDTQLDIAVAYYGINSIGILLGYGNGSFRRPIITFLSSARPLSLVTGDFNKDNHLDIVVATYGTFTIIILLGSGDGSFLINTIYDMGYDSNPYSLVVTDFNNDNRLDIAVVNYGTNNLIILLANGNASFIQQKYSTDHGSHPCSIAIGDFNNDNTLDIAITNSNTSNVGIFLGHENGTFRNMMTYSTGSKSRPQFIVVTDLNNDTKLDIIVIDSGNNNVIVLRGDGYGNFSIITTHSTGYNSDPSSIAIGDFDNDNKPDIVITNKATNNIFVLTAYIIRPATSQTTYPTEINSKPYYVAASDLNHDNFSDIVVANRDSGTIGIFINLGNGTFRDQITIPIAEGSQLTCVAVVDVNNDKHLDIVMLLAVASAIVILPGYGNGSFGDIDFFLTGNHSYPLSFAVDDLNNDTMVDIIVANYQSSDVAIFLGYGNGTFQRFTTYVIRPIFYPASIVLNDLNHDKILDIVICDNTLGGIAILLGYGNGSFNTSLILSTNDDRPNSLAIGDLNNDDQLDIIYVNYVYSSISILFGYRNGMFGNISRYFTGSSGSIFWYVTVVDLNDDTQLDIVVTSLFSYSIGVFFGFGNGSFAPQKTFSTGFLSNPTSIAFSDFNNDNQLDVVVSNYGTDTIGVFLLHYEMDFTYESSYLTGSGPHPYSIGIGDFNKDNQSDIVVANPGNDNIQLLLGYNKGTFMNEITYSTGFGSYPLFVSVADFNRDNQLDIVVCNNRNDTINVFLGHDNGTFDKPILYSTGSNSFPISIAFGDFNKDNWTDVVVANNGTNNVAVFLGFDYATFTNESFSIHASLSNPSYVAVGDVNNDYLWDIIVGDIFDHNVHIFLGYGNGTFAEKRSFSTGNDTATSIVVDDLNKDKQLDIVVTYGNGDNVGIFIGYGNGSFQSQVTYFTGKSSTPYSAAVGDLNNDNILDIVVGNYKNDTIGVFIGYGDGSFTDQVLYLLPNGSLPRWVAVTDVDKDNNLDIVVANSGQDNIGIIFGCGNGTFRSMMKLFTGNNSRPFSIVVEDFNNDTWIDIAVINRNTINVGIFLGYGNGTFSSQITHSTGSQWDLFSINIADLNNDTKLDIIVSDLGNDYGNIGVLYGYGDGNFTLLKTYATGFNSNPTSVAICDFNGDNRLDMATNYLYLGNIGIMLQRSSEPFTTPVLFFTGNDSHPRSVATGDINNDDQLDIIVANSGTNNIGILLGNGNGTFTQQQNYSTGNNSEPVSIALGDFNNDSHLDIVVVNSKANTIVIFRGYGNGTVTLLTTYSTGISSIPSSIAVKDLNKDNYLDIVVSNYGTNHVLVFLGSNNETFLESKLYALDYNAHPQSVAIGDINNDSLLDIIVANYGADSIEILLQTC